MMTWQGPYHISFTTAVSPSSSPVSLLPPVTILAPLCSARLVSDRSPQGVGNGETRSRVRSGLSFLSFPNHHFHILHYWEIPVTKEAQTLYIFHLCFSHLHHRPVARTTGEGGTVRVWRWTKEEAERRRERSVNGDNVNKIYLELAI